MFPMVHLALVFAFGPAIGKQMSECSLKKVLKKTKQKTNFKKKKKGGSFYSSLSLQEEGGWDGAWDGDEQRREALLYLFVCF